MSDQDLTNLSKILSLGEVIAYPTEAVWGLGCDPFNEQAVLKILSVKKRPIEKGLILVASHIDQLNGLLDHLSEEQQQLLLADQGCPATWLIPHRGKIPQWISGEHSTVAVRISTHPTVVELCDSFGGMLVSTSANPAGLEPAVTEAEARAYFGSTISHYVAGETGSSEQPSAIIDLQSGKRLR